MRDRTVSVNSILLVIYSYPDVLQLSFRKGWKKVKEVSLESKTNLVFFLCSFVLLARKDSCCLIIIYLQSKYSIAPKTCNLLVPF